MELNGEVAAASHPNGVHPFAILPEEMWAYTGEKLEDSAEILNLIKAIPEVEGALQARKRYWIFDQVVPHLSKFLRPEDIRACRQVCKKWNYGVANYSDNSPFFRAYDHDNQVTGQIWTVNGRPYSRCFPYSILPTATAYFQSEERITAFLELMEKNPFSHRSVYLASWEDLGVLTRASEIFQRFSHQIWNLQLSDLEHVDPEPFANCLREWLGQLPNLKSLSLDISLEVRIPWDLQAFLNMVAAAEMPRDGEENLDAAANDLEDEAEEAVEDPGQVAAEDMQEPQENAPLRLPEYLERWLEPLPPLPQLESLNLKWVNFPPPTITRALVSAYSSHIRRFHLNFRQWKPEFSDAFPNLTELHVERIPNILGLTTLLLPLNSPRLYDLELQLAYIYQYEIDVRNHIFPWLRRFPLIRNLVFDLIEPEVTGGDDIIDLATDTFPSLKYLSIGKSFIHANSDFLRCFPNLECLDIQYSFSVPEGRAPVEPTIQIWEAIQNLRLYESNVWEHLPKLRRIAAPATDDDWEQGAGFGEEHHFKREMYEYNLRRGAEAEEGN